MRGYLLNPSPSRGNLLFRCRSSRKWMFVSSVQDSMSAMRIPILAGRDFSEADRAGKLPVALISSSIAKRFWPGENALGKRLTLTFRPGYVREVVGIVGDVKLDSLDQSRPKSTTLYVPLEQISMSSAGGGGSFPLTLVVRSAINPRRRWFTAVSNAVYSVDPDVPLPQHCHHGRPGGNFPCRLKGSTCCYWELLPGSHCCWRPSASTAFCRTAQNNVFRKSGFG